jgi:glutathione S-transferase
VTGETHLAELILHHYDMSPYAEKIRLCLGLKGLPWRSVQTPMVLPKPDHFELTGGYRRVPVLQLGADVYCDTHLISRVLDRVQASPPLSPPGREVEELAFSRWAESTFMMAIFAFFGIGGVFPQEFIDDRSKTMVPPGTDVAQAGIILPTKLLQIRANVDRIDQQLADGRRFVLGDEPGVADFSAFHPLMMLGIHERTAALIAPYERVTSWLERVRAIGHGKPSDLDVAEAIAIAREAEPASFEGEPVLPDGMELGTPVTVLHDEYGSGTVSGELAASGLHEIAIRRQTERAGEVVVHFPRADFTVIAIG